MAASHCNFSERELDAWVANTLAGYTADPSTIPSDGDAWLIDRGGKNSVPGLRLRLRLRREGGQYTTADPNVDFYLLRKFDGRKRTLLIGDRAVYSVEMARNKATDEQQDLAKGVDKREERRREEESRKVLALTYRQALEEVIAGEDLAPNTIKKYQLSLTTTFAKYADKPLADFTPELCKQIFKARSLESPSRADQDFRVLRLVWNAARELHLDAEGGYILGPNPVPLALNKRRATGRGRAQKAQWNMVARRETLIPQERTAEWFATLQTIRADAVTNTVASRTCDLLEALTITGCRFNELAKLEWSAVDLGRGYIKIPAPLGKNRRPLVKPITRHLRAILDRRLAERHLFPHTELIWPGRQMNQPDPVAAGPISDPRFVLGLVKERIGLEVTPHDLRRGWASAALCAGVPQEAIKRLMNHLTNNEDVTSGYQILDLNTLRALSQQVEDFLLRSGAAPGKDPNATDTMLDALLSELDEAEKRRLLFDLSAKRLERVA